MRSPSIPSACTSSHSVRDPIAMMAEAVRFRPWSQLSVDHRYTRWPSPENSANCEPEQLSTLRSCGWPSAIRVRVAAISPLETVATSTPRWSAEGRTQINRFSAPASSPACQQPSQGSQRESKVCWAASDAGPTSSNKERRGTFFIAPSLNPDVQAHGELDPTQVDPVGVVLEAALHRCVGPQVTHVRVHQDPLP